MTEKKALELIEHLQSMPSRTAAILEGLEEIQQVVAWSRQQEKSEILIRITTIVANDFAHLRHTSAKKRIQEPGDSVESVEKLWQQGIVFALQGLAASRKSGDMDYEFTFLQYLSRLYRNLGDYSTAKQYLQSQISIYDESEVKEQVARSLYLLGHDSHAQADFLTARECYQMSIDIYQNSGNTYAMANIMAFMAVNEEMDNNLDLAQYYIDRSVELKKQYKDGLEASE